MDELPFSLNEQGFEVVIGIASFVSRCPVADFEIHNLFCGFIDQAVSIACACLETCAHSRTELGSTFVGVQRGLPFENVDELVLPGVGMTKGRNCTGSQAREIHAKVCEAEKIAKLALLSAHHTRRETAQDIRRACFGPALR